MLWVQLIRLIGIFIAIIMVWTIGIRRIRQILKDDRNDEWVLPEKEDHPIRSYSYDTAPQNLCQLNISSPPQNITQTIHQPTENQTDQIRFQMIRTRLDQLNIPYQILYADNKPIDMICYGPPKETGHLRSEILKHCCSQERHDS